MTTATTIIRGGLILDPTRHRAVPVDILLDGDAIREIGRPDLAAPPGAGTLDARIGCCSPALVNAHTHPARRARRGLVPDGVLRRSRERQPRA